MKKNNLTLANRFEFSYDDALKQKLINFMHINKISNKSEVIRDALHDYIDKDIIDQNIIVQSLQRLISKIENMDELLKMFTDFMIFFLKVWYAHTPEIPNEQKNAAWEKGEIRFDKLCIKYKETSINNLSFINRLLMEQVDTNASDKEESA